MRARKTATVNALVVDLSRNTRRRDLTLKSYRAAIRPDSTLFELDLSLSRISHGDAKYETREIKFVNGCESALYRTAYTSTTMQKY